MSTNNINNYTLVIKCSNIREYKAIYYLNTLVYQDQNNTRNTTRKYKSRE